VPKKNLQTRYAEALMAQGYEEITTTRYVGCRAFKLPGGTRTFFIGKAGSVRAGQTRSSSIALSGRFKASLLAPSILKGE
jgi:hypothetical protein